MVNPNASFWFTGRIAIVAGATRGAGRGIACMLGEAGATVYCSGRSTRQYPATSGFYAGRPETIDETAEIAGSVGVHAHDSVGNGGTAIGEEAGVGVASTSGLPDFRTSGLFYQST